MPTATDSSRDWLDMAGGVRVIGFLGRFMEQKGFLPLVHALRELSASDTNLPFHLVAVGSGDYRNEYAAVLRRLALSRHLTILHFTPTLRPILPHPHLLV